MQMVLFGQSKAGTLLLLLLASPRAGLDLPLKALAWEDADGRVWLSANAPEYVLARHGLPDALIANIAGARSPGAGGRLSFGLSDLRARSRCAQKQPPD
jgi:uncharacterized protein (DUF302 family)